MPTGSCPCLPRRRPARASSRRCGSATASCAIRLGRIDQRHELAVANTEHRCGSRPGRASGLRRGSRQGRRRPASGSRSSPSPEIPRLQPRGTQLRPDLRCVCAREPVIPTNIPAGSAQRLPIPLSFEHKLAPDGGLQPGHSGSIRPDRSSARPPLARCKTPHRQPAAIRRSGMEPLPPPATRSRGSAN